MPNNQIPIIDLILCLSQAVDMISPLLADHHRRVAYIAFSLAGELGLPEAECRELALAGALHDIGGLALQERIDLLDFEINDPGKHGELGYLLIRPFRPLAGVARLIRRHHVFWRDGAGAEADGQSVPLGSHLLHLADRVAILINPNHEILGQDWEIRSRIRSQAGNMFHPEQVRAFCSLAVKEYFWLDTVSPGIDHILSQRASWPAVQLETDDLLELARLFCRTIDFRSPYTSTHSSGVAATAELLAEAAGFSPGDCHLIKVAGYLHDLGKLAVPPEILNKPARLTRQEYDVMRHHTYLTDRLLEPIGLLDTIRSWSALHHERLDGSGYPFHLSDEQIPPGARIMAVADVFVALVESRPYREGMSKSEALQVIHQMAEQHALDPAIVGLLEAQYERVDAARCAAQMAAVQEYGAFFQVVQAH